VRGRMWVWVDVQVGGCVRMEEDTHRNWECGISNKIMYTSPQLRDNLDKYFFLVFLISHSAHAHNFQPSGLSTT